MYVCAYTHVCMCAGVCVCHASIIHTILSSFVCQLDTSLAHQGKESQLREASMRSDCEVFSHFVINGGRLQPIVGGSTSGLVVLRKQTKQTRGSNPVNSTHPCPLHQPLPSGSYLD